MAATFTITFTASELQMTLCAVDDLKTDVENRPRRLALLRVRAKLADALKVMPVVDPPEEWVRDLELGPRRPLKRSR